MENLALFVVIVVVEVLLIFWAALIVLAIKGLLFHRRNPETDQADQHDNTIETDEQSAADEMPQPGLSLGCTACLLFLFWPMALGGMIDKWLSRKVETTH